ncbi:acyltransferase family protein [Oxobacter pfennigii]|nr:acyltransferase family protein [Oxobacter pfennigii]
MRAILCVLIVFLHSNLTSIQNFNDTMMWAVVKIIKEVLSVIIANLAVPLFFVISSMLLYSKEFTWKENIVKKVRSIGLPYFLWNTLLILFYLFVQNIHVLRTYFSDCSTLITQFSWEDWIDAYLGIFNKTHPIIGPFWFLKDLFFMNVLAIVIKRIVDKIPFFSFGVIVLFWIGIFEVPYISNLSVVFFTLGYFLVKYKISVKAIDKINAKEIIALYLLLIILVLKLGSKYFILQNISILFGMLTLIYVSKHLIQSDLFNLFILIAQHSFVIFACHKTLVTIFFRIAFKLLPQILIVELFQYLFIPILTIVCCIILEIIIKKLSPKFCRMLVGGR